MMKKIFFFLIFLNILGYSQNVEGLLGIEKKIRHCNNLNSLEEKIACGDSAYKTLEKITLSSENIDFHLKYWKSYVSFSLFNWYIQKQDKKNAESILKRGIEIANIITNKNSEVYALLAFMESAYFVFILPQDYYAQSIKVQELIGKAMEKNNIRAHLISAFNDFYTPKQYGGRAKTEVLLLEAIKLQDTYDKSPFAPSWGKDQCYELLVKFYIEEKKDRTLSQKYLDLFKEKYPSDQKKQNKLQEMINLELKTP